jgi:hypothetical protein
MELKGQPTRGPVRDLNPSGEVIEVVEKVKGRLRPFWGDL